MSTLTLQSVKCIKPSSGINTIAINASKLVGAAVGGIAGGVAGSAATVATGGVLVATIGVAAVGGAGLGNELGEGAVVWLDTVFSGKDDLYVKVNGNKVWPDGDYQGIDSQETVTLEQNFALDKNVKIELMEYDTISSDDNLGYLEFFPDHQTGTFVYAIPNDDEGSIYEMVIKIA